MKLPVIFCGHGSPINAIADNDFTRALKNLGKELIKPDAILCISAHWQTKGTKILAQKFPKMIYDFHGFPKELNEIKYPAPGAQYFATRTQQLLPEAELVQIWGIDHGAWSILVHLFPKADIPVFQLSLNTQLNEQQHFSLAKKLYSLRNEGVLILGSGNIVHNLNLVKPRGVKPYDWALEFDENIKSNLEKNDFNSIVSYDRKNLNTAPIAVPTKEHFLPLIYCVANVDPDDHIEYAYEGFEYASISLRSIIWS